MITGVKCKVILSSFFYVFARNNSDKDKVDLSYIITKYVIRTKKYNKHPATHQVHNIVPSLKSALVISVFSLIMIPQYNIDLVGTKLIILKYHVCSSCLQYFC